ncbi:MAG: PHP domain-containing protein [Lachnospiraceae bacterium]
MKAIDLHVHSSRSDGSKTPSELVDMARQLGLAAFALTDHDTIAGLDEAVSYAESLRLQGHLDVPQVIPGIELSTMHNKKDLHILGLFIDYQKPDVISKLLEFEEARVVRNKKMCAKLQADGINISYELLVESFPGAIITRAHYGEYLVAHGYSLSVADAFSQYLGDHTKYFVPREAVSPKMAIDLILSAGGIPIFAHPIHCKMSAASLDTLVCELKNMGLMGIEALYTTYTAADERQIRRLAAKYNLLISGGSDYHGSAKPRTRMGTGFGHLYVPEDILYQLNK